jgi:signal transduction histidine kinase/CheY-like chemotaxis protein
MTFSSKEFLTKRWPKIGSDPDLFRHFVDELPLRVFVFDRSGELLYANQTFIDALGCTFEQVHRMAGMIIAKDRKLFTKVVRKVIYEHKEFVVPEFTLTRPHDDKQIFFIRFRPLKLLCNGDPAEVMIGVAQDVTDRKRANDMVIQHAREIELLHSTGQQLSETLDLKSIYRTFFDLVSGIMPHDDLFVSSFDPDKELIYCEYAIADGVEVDASKLPPVALAAEGTGLQSQAIRSGKPMMVNDVQKQTKACSQVHYIDEESNVYSAEEIPEEEEKTQSALIVPLILAGKTVGAIQVFSYKQDAFTDKDLSILQSMALQIAVASNNALLYQKAQAELSERVKLQAALEEERNLLAQRVEERTAELIAANLDLQQALQIKDEFLANMSHELRTPLNAILGMRESLTLGTYGQLEPRQEKPLRHIKQSGEHLLELINDVLDLTKIQAGHVSSHPVDFNMTALVQECHGLMEEMASRKQINLHFDSGGKDWRLHADERQLRQVLLNLLSNAIKFTDEGGSVGIEMDAAQEAGMAALIVWDTGIGIKQKDMDKLFKPFVQLDSGLSRKFEGTGLGLALSTRLVEMNGGKLSVESEGIPGNGSRFIISLPAVPEGLSAEALPQTEDDKPSLPVRLVSKGRVLVAEDNMANRETLSSFLWHAGYEVTIALDGQQAVDQALETRPDLIIMDIQMPVLDGLEAIRRIRQDEGMAAVPIIALTALVMPGDKERCLAAGADLYLSKPVGLRKLMDIVGDMLAARGTSAD